MLLSMMASCAADVFGLRKYKHNDAGDNDLDDDDDDNGGRGARCIVILIKVVVVWVEVCQLG